MNENPGGKMRLELNLPALERMLAGDSEIEVHLRHQIVEEFAKKHLIAIQKDETFKEMLKLYQAQQGAAVQAEIAAMRASMQGGNSGLRWSFEEPFKQAFEQLMKTHLERSKKELDEAILSAARIMSRELTGMVRAEIQKEIKAQFEAWTKAEIEENVRNRIEEVMTQVRAGLESSLLQKPAVGPRLINAQN